MMGQLVGLVMVLAMASAVVPAVAVGAGGSSGSFAFGGKIVGRLKVLPFAPLGKEPSCIRIGKTIDEVTWSKARLTVGGQATTALVRLEVSVPRFGGRVQLSGGHAFVQLSTNLSTKAPDESWVSKAGTVSTVESGASGAVNGTLHSLLAPGGVVTVKGSFAGCRT